MKKLSIKAMSLLMACLIVAGSFIGSAQLNIDMGLTASAVENTEKLVGEGWSLVNGEIIITENIEPDEDGLFGWSEYAQEIKTATFYGENVDTIPDGAFTGTSIEVLYIPSTIKHVTKHAFDDGKGDTISSLKTIYYGGSSETFDELNSEINTTNVKVVYFHVHNEIIKNDLEPDCVTENDGYSGDTYCTECLTLVTVGEAIPFAFSHKWSNEGKLYMSATCEKDKENYNNDIYALKCERCGAWNESSAKKEPNQVEHDLSIVVEKSEYLCGDEGSTYIAKCSVCGIEQNVNTPEEHVYTTESSTAATCTNEGKNITECKYCSYKNEEIVPPLGHTRLAEKRIEATCEQAGEIVTYCTACNAKISSVFIKATGHNYAKDWEVIKDPTCEESGLKAKICLNEGCDSCVEATPIPVHTNGYYETEYAIDEATCSAEGKKTLVCKACKEEIIDIDGKTITEVIPIDKSAHSVGEWIEVEPATCVKDGYHIKKCNNCGIELNRETLPATGHKYEFVETADCTEGGGTAQKECEYCGDKQKITVAASDTHNIEKKVVTPTCTSKGYTIEICKTPGCGYKSGEYAHQAALGHDTDSTQWEIVNDATCTEDGLKVRKCARYGECGYSTEETITATGHTVTHKVENATCIAEGREYDFCSKCKEETNEKVLAKIAHSITTVVTEPTCEAEGYTIYACSACGMSYKDDIESALGHDLDEGVVVNPTCTEDGYIIKTCKRNCDYTVRLESEEKATGHSPVVDAEVKPTCIEDGLTEGAHCSACEIKLIEQETVPALGHVIKNVPSIEPNCTETGLTEGKVCTVCGKMTLEQIVIDALGHKPAEAIIENKIEATCTEDGSYEETIYCTACDEEINRKTTVIYAHHTEVVDAAVEPTCVKTGLTEGRHCSVCEQVIVEQNQIAAKGHTIVTDRAIAPKCLTPGKTEGKHCAACEEVIVAQKVIKALGHSEVVDAAVESTCTKTGLTEGKHCSVCNAIIVKQDTTPMKEHKYEVKSIEKEATAFTSGLKRIECKDCKKTDSVKYSLTFFQRIAWIFNQIVLSINNVFDGINKIISGVNDNLN